MISVDYRESWKKARSFVQSFNETKVVGLQPSGAVRYNLKKKLRPAHYNLLCCMIRLYSVQLRGYEYLTWDQNIPPFHTNSPALAKLMDCTPKTIRSLIGRLFEAGAIEEKEAKGRKHDYKITFSKEVIQTGKGAFSRRDLARNEARQRTLENQLLEDEIGKRLPQLDTIQKKKNNLGGGYVDKGSPSPASQCADSVPFSGNSRLQKEDEGGNDNHKRPECHKETRLQKHGPGEGGETPPDPGHADAPPLNWSKLDDYHTRLFSLIIATLYQKLPYLADSQSFHIKRFLAHEFAGKAPDDYEKVYQQLRVRVLIAEAWLKRKADRFIPIPEIYFDPDNPNGFGRTADWYADTAMTTQKVEQFKKRYSLVMQSWGAFMTTIDNSLIQPGLEGYQEGRKAVKAQYAPLVRAYDFVILQTLHNQTAE